MPNVDQLVFVAFNSHVVALQRESGELVWSWKSPKGGGFVAVLLDGDRLIASVQGYTYCLDPRTGELLWSNPLKGLGTGVPCLASVRGTTNPVLFGLLAQQAEEDAAAAQHSTSAGG